MYRVFMAGFRDSVQIGLKNGDTPRRRKTYSLWRRKITRLANFMKFS